MLLGIPVALGYIMTDTTTSRHDDEPTDDDTIYLQRRMAVYLAMLDMDGDRWTPRTVPAALAGVSDDPR